MDTIEGMGRPRMDEEDATKAMIMLSSSSSPKVDEIGTTEPTDTTVSNSEEADDTLDSEAIPSTTSSDSGPQLFVNDGDVICGRGKMAFHHGKWFQYRTRSVAACAFLKFAHQLCLFQKHSGQRALSRRRSQVGGNVPKGRKAAGEAGDCTIHH